MERIFPFSVNPITWYNYSNYLNWIDHDIFSLKDYLDYFNPNFKIFNLDLYSIASNTWEQETITANTSSYSGPSGDETSGYIYDPTFLKFREGILNTKTNAKIILNDKTYNFPVSTFILARKWTHSGLQNDNTNPEKFDINHYQFIGMPQAILYVPQSIPNGLQFTMFKNANTEIGTNLMFSLELSPTRYFLSDDRKAQWGTNTSWTTQGATWSSPTADIQLITQNKAGQIWNNSYPLMHELYLHTENGPIEEFIIDNDFEIETINIANHNTMLYNINVKNINSNEINDMWDNIHVSIL